ncbi:hypothetical protein D3C81_1467810 [compost metagenome]
MRCFFPLRNANWGDFCVKPTGFEGGGRFLLGVQGEGILLLATDGEFIRQIFGGNTHMVVVERIPQPVMHHAVFQAGMTQT